jgi:hypothetical protein
MLTCAAADFPNGGRMAKNGANNLQNGIFIIFTGLRKRFMGHKFNGLMLFCCFNCTVFKNGSKTNQ